MEKGVGRQRFTSEQIIAKLREVDEGPLSGLASMTPLARNPIVAG